jgi:hypothetical protein
MMVSRSVDGLPSTHHRDSGRNRTATIVTQPTTFTTHRTAYTANAVAALSPSSPIIITNT